MQLSLAQAPDITAIEFYLDVDPGFGSGTPISITASPLQDLNFSVPTGSLTPGFHTLFVRAFDANGEWSHFESQPFYIAKSTTETRNNLTAWEYYLDTDPGQGNGTVTMVTPSTDLNINELIPTSSLSLGFHTIYFRAQDAAGVWSMPEGEPFFISLSTTETINNIDLVEYFFDVDPGFGSGVQLAQTPASNIDFIETVDVSSLSRGFHTIYFRVKDEAGQWSSTESEPFFISVSTTETINNIDLVEYFFDVDPGFGSGLQLAQTPASNIDFIEMVDVSSLSRGFHTIYFRVKDEAGQWSTTESEPFFISVSTTEIINNIDLVEYFFDVDPGFGSGVQLAQTPATNLDFTEMVDVSSLSAGFHTIYFRVKDEAGQWSASESEPFFITLSSTQVRTTITNMEYYFDQDPGFGNGQPLPISPGMDVNETITISTSALSDGMHTIYVRGLDDRGQWSHFESQPFLKDPTRLVSTIEYAFDTDPGTGMGVLGPYVDPIDVADKNLIIPTTGLSPGNHDIFVRAQDGSEAWSLTSQETFEVILAPPGNALDFDGIDDYVEIPDDDVAFDRITGFTLEAWIKPTNLNGTVQHIAGINNSFRIIIDGQNQLLLGTSDGMTVTNATIPAALLEQDQVTHVAATFDGTNGKLYINGLEIHDEPGMSAPQNQAIPFYIGGLTTSESFFGQIDEVRLWDNARTQDQIQSTQFIMLNGDETGLVSYYRFDQGIANDTNTGINQLPDRSPNSNLGTLNNFLLDGLVSNWVPSLVPLVTEGVIEADREALTDLYNALGGANWSDNSNWLWEDVSTWFGVTVISNRVRAIELPDNNLVGDLPASLTELTGLTTLDVSGNAITSLPDMSTMPVLVAPNVSANALQFESLEPNALIAGIDYSSQAIQLEEIDNLVEVNDAVTINRTILGNNNVYAWYKDDVLITNTSPNLTFGSVQFTDEGTYRVEVTNTVASGLTITSANYILKVSSLARDKIALTNIYNATGGPDWIDNTNWLSDDVSTWFGVTVANNRVTALSLPTNNLQGNMPTDLRDIGQIVEINLEGNELRSLPDETRLTQLTTLNVIRNRLGFGDLEPNLPITNFSYDPQRRFGVTLNERVQVNEDFEVSIEISGVNNVYQWYRKPRGADEESRGEPVTNADSSAYLIEGINFDNMGIYYVEVTSPLIPGFSIRNRNQNIFAVTDMFGTVYLETAAGLVMNEGDVLVYEVTEPGQPFIPTDTALVDSEGKYFIDDVVLGNFILVARPGAVYIEDVLQTYYLNTNDWVFATTVPLRDVVQGIDIDMLSVPIPFDPLAGDGEIFGLVESDFPDFIDPEAGLRVEARRRVRRAGVSLNKLVTRRRTLQEEFVLIAYTETDENGEFEFLNVPPGDYFINIQIPGVPMDTASFIKITIEENVQNQTFSLFALALPDAISVELLKETGFRRKYFDELSVYPNPANDYLRVTYERLKHADLDIRLIDLTGKRVWSITINDERFGDLEFDTSDLDAGVYVLNIVNPRKADISVAHYRILIEH